MLLFALTIFTSAFLLFQVQPLIARFILPWFGGAPTVWTTCMLFFQIVLLLGYLYADLVNRWLRPRSQVILHTILALAALFLLLAFDDRSTGSSVVRTLLPPALSLPALRSLECRFTSCAPVLSDGFRTPFGHPDSV